MAYIPGAGRALAELLDDAAAKEAPDSAADGEFIARIGKIFKVALSVAAAGSLAIGVPLAIFVGVEIGLLFVGLGVCAALFLPSIFSYRCVVNKTFLREEYVILFFIARKNEVLWSDVKYRKIRLDGSKVVKLYNENKKCLVSFDGSIVGFQRIAKMATRSAIKDITKT